MLHVIVVSQMGDSHLANKINVVGVTTEDDLASALLDDLAIIHDCEHYDEDSKTWFNDEQSVFVRRLVTSTF